VFRGCDSGLSEGSALLSAGGFAAGDAAQHLVDRGPADHLLGGGWVAFVVAGQPPAGGDPGQRPLDDPTLGMDLEPALPVWLAHDVDHRAQCAFRPVDQPAVETGVGEHVPDRRRQVDAERGGFGAVAVLPRRGQDGDTDQQAERVGDDEPLTPVGFLTRVVAT
jgi:hypothetical protein